MWFKKTKKTKNNEKEWHIVKFKDGNYGVRRYIDYNKSYEFYSMTRNDDVFSSPCNVHSYCKTDSIEKATKVYNILTDSGEPI